MGENGGGAGNLFDGIVVLKNTPANIAAVQSKMIAPNFIFTVEPPQPGESDFFGGCLV